MVSGLQRRSDQGWEQSEFLRQRAFYGEGGFRCEVRDMRGLHNRFMAANNVQPMAMPTMLGARSASLGLLPIVGI